MKNSNNDSWRGRYETQKQISTRLAAALKTTADTLHGLRSYLTALESAYTEVKKDGDPTFEELYAKVFSAEVPASVSDATGDTQEYGIESGITHE